MNDNKLVKNFRKVVFENYANFGGRARREEYWFFALANVIVTFVLAIVLGLIGLDIVSNLYSLAVFIPSIAVSIRRMHDIGKSGWVLLLGLIPVIGWIILIVWAAKDSEKGSNAYGTSEKYPNAA